MTRSRFLHETGRGVLLIVLVGAVNAYAGRKGWYERYELIDFDHLAQSAKILRGSLSPDIGIVEIGDRDYKELFDRKSPLKPDRVVEIICGILNGHPRVLVVDLDTSDWPAGTRRALENTPTPVVWSVQPDADGNLPPEPGVLRGVPAFRPGRDGRLRTYPQSVIVGTRKDGRVSSLVTAAAAAIDPANPSKTDTGEDLLIGFGLGYHRFHTIPASAFVGDRLDPGFYRSAINGKIVFLGGSFRESRDRYATPLGEESGVEILARATQTEYSGQSPAKREFYSFAEECLIGIFVLLVVLWFGPAVRLIVSTILAVAVAILASRYFYEAAVFLPVCTVFGGVVAAGVFELAKRYYYLNQQHKRDHPAGSLRED